jgi:para-nitrobenzyl esterase
MKILLALLTGAVALPAAIDEPVRLDTGLVSGASGSNPDVRVFKGVPFAAPPLGALRWRPPQPAAHWEGVRKADQFSSTCTQPPRSGTSLLLPTAKRLGETSEDCLYLNVWTAAKSPRERLPVMVYIHGGGYRDGSGSGLVFDGEALAKKGVVLVTINYRLGIMGFFAHPELTKESDYHTSGNYGLLDQMAALQWVQKNIAGFGGDRNRVTIFGQSAGSGSVLAMMASPLTKGLFQRAIGESGGPPMGRNRTRKEAEEAGAKLGSLADLRAKPFQDLLRSGGSGPIVDGWLLPEDESVIFHQGKQNDVALIVGSNAEEANVLGRPVPAKRYVEQIEQRYGSLAAAYLKFYPADSEERAKASQMAALNDSMAWQMRTWAKWQTQTGKSKAYLYYFTRQPPPDAPIKGAAHDAELYYVFHNLNLYPQQWAEWDHRLEEIISSYWVNFATRGDPNGASLPHWDAYSASQGDRVMLLGDKVELGSSRFEKTKLDFLESYYAQQLAQ